MSLQNCASKSSTKCILITGIDAHAASEVVVQAQQASTYQVGQCISQKYHRF